MPLLFFLAFFFFCTKCLFDFISLNNYYLAFTVSFCSLSFKMKSRKV